MFSRFASPLSMALLASTNKIKVAAAPMSPYSRNPMITAMSIATMDEFAPGRVIASPGTGNAAALKEAGMESPHPLQTMREYVEILRRYFRGDAVNFQGKMFQINGAKMGFIPSKPIDMYITAVRPLMLQLGGEIGDGVLLSGGCSPGYIARCVEEIASRRRKAASLAANATSRDLSPRRYRTTPRKRSKPTSMFLAYIFRNVHHAENIRLGGGTRRSGRARGGSGKTRLGGGEEIHQRRSSLCTFGGGHTGTIVLNSWKLSLKADSICRSFCRPGRRRRASEWCAWCARLLDS